MEGGNKSIKRYKWKLNFTSVTEKIDKELQNYIFTKVEVHNIRSFRGVAVITSV